MGHVLWSQDLLLGRYSSLIKLDSVLDWDHFILLSVHNHDRALYLGNLLNVVEHVGNNSVKRADNR